MTTTIVLVLMALAIVYLIKQVRDLRAIVDRRGTEIPVPPVEDTPGRSAKDVAQDLLDRHIMEYHRGGRR